ncbi:efflux RND transporter periplasmic adaptor subunit [Desulfobacterota bacterium M19]
MNKVETEQDNALAEALKLGSPPARKRHLKKILIWGVVLLAAAFGLLRWSSSDNDTIQFKTQPVRRGNITVTVTATGNLAPTNQVEVGSELSGIVREVTVDYNDRVKVGEVLARLDTTRLKAQVLQSKAALTSARANLLQTRATTRETRLELQRLREAQARSNKQAVSVHDLDAAQAALERAKANQDSAEAAIAQAKATLEINQTDLGKLKIVSPINGVVLARSVDPGQTVAASLQAPVLFTLAEDLTRMELHVDVDEADVGQVKKGQKATFTVDAYPNRIFPARITQVRYDSRTVAGVVSYETVLDVRNSDLSLRPGMTATATITVKKVKNAVIIPNAALRFAPPREETGTSRRGGIFSRMFRRRPRAQSRPPQKNPAHNQQRVWILRGRQPVAVLITTGATDGTMTEVTAGKIKPGQRLIVDTVSGRK